MPPPRFNITESFGWLSPEAFDLHSVGKNTIKIKGVAVPAGATSKNRRKYVEEELVRAARTLIGKPITINHDPNRIIGNVEWAEHEGGLTEYLATIKKQPYVDMLRAHHKDILGVSVEADYLHNKCTICGDRFYSEESFRSHMQSAHGIKEGVTAPHGMNYKALSLVVAPEIPGVSSTTVELMETLHKTRGLHPLSQLLETVTDYKQKQQAWETKMKDKIVIQPENRTTLDRIKEQTDTAEPAPPPADLSAPPTANMDAPPPPEAPDNIEPPTHDTSTSEPECPEGSHYDPVSGTCVPDEIPEVSPPQNAPIETPSVGETDQLKVSPPIPEEPAPSPPSAEAPPLPPAEEQPAPQEQQNAAPECPVGSHYDEFSNTCIPDEIPAVTEIKFDKPLKLGEPFANYDSFDACVAANQDKDDPEAYCASLENKTEKQPASEIWSPQRGHIRDIKLATAINSQSKKLEEIYTILSKAIAETGKPVATEAKLRAKQGKTLKQLITETQTQHAVLKGLVETHQKNSLAETAKTEQTAQNQLEEIKKLRDAHNETVTFFTAKLAEVCASLKTASENMQNFTDSLTKTQTGYNTKIATIQNLTTKIQETQTNCNTKIEALEQQRQEDKQAYETILEAVNKRYGELKDNTKTLEDRIKEQEDELEKRKCEEGYHYDEKEQKCVPDTPPEQAEETKKLTETVENLSTKVDNLTDKLKGDFKAHNPKPVKETADDAPINDNMRTGN